ncbi:tRNA (cytidine(34)-2'-O)-methyltransferase [Oribacterium sp. WCC10]|uniref:tRNA (cytidine(34)-2'-O)-methyltransferase n=1 Tax=Oribacterium sp. WCC10 TaxID=1855343 RepID=UPI0008EC2DA6|nr:tRNA (cytidine(34)-2'-O)-methyltransferase [Oribacterium sp. WCC10]SFG13826.1 tRNA (cytidine/uridine-2'-O-)-methyltransferase [Oribacterium sp. WCC10]
MLNIVLHEPEIPFNTGAIGRTCVATNTNLHLIRPYGFELSDKYVKRAGMDYWPKLHLSEYLDYKDFLAKHPEIHFADEFCEDSGDAESAWNDFTNRSKEVIETPKLWFATTKAQYVYSDVTYGPNDYIMFGKESAGIPEEILVEHPKSCVRIPMWGDMRSLNLSNSAAIMVYEAYRQNDFMDLSRKGELHRLHW